MKIQVPADIQRIAKSWVGDKVFEAASRPSYGAPFRPDHDVVVGGMRMIREGARDSVIDAAAHLTGRWRDTPLAVVDLGRGYFLVSQTHRDGRLFTPSDLRPGLWRFSFGSPKEVVAVIDHTAQGISITEPNRA